MRLDACCPHHPRPVVEIGDAHGKIALFLTEDSAHEVIAGLGHGSWITGELLVAIPKAYPDEEEEHD